MALEPITLDDLTWSDMVLAIRRRLAAASEGSWTLHAAVDPGVTLVELFSWMLEQRLYWMDQVPDTFVRAALKLLGTEMRPARPAATVLQFESKQRDFSTVPVKSRMRLRPSSTLVFTTDRAVTLLPVERIEISIDGVNRSPELDQGQPVKMFACDGSAAEVKLVLWLRRNVPSAAAGSLTAADGPRPTVSLLFLLRMLARIQPQWHSDAVNDVPLPAQVTWWYGAEKEPKPFAWVKDGTEGFRRSGLVELPLPDDWKVDGDLKSGLIPYAIWIRVAESTFASAPRLERIVPNVAIARHERRTKWHRLQRGWLPLPGNPLELANLSTFEPEKDHPPIESSVKLKMRERQTPAEAEDSWSEWTRVPDLAFSGPGDRHFVVDRERGVLRFGDGLTGRLPRLASIAGCAETVKVRYTVGGGVIGNVGGNLQWQRLVAKGDASRKSRCGSAFDEVEYSATNVAPAVGGMDPETIAEARERLAGSLRRQERAVTREDFEDLAETTPGVAIRRAHAAIGRHPEHPCPVPGAVTVFVVPDAPRSDPRDDAGECERAPIPDPGAMSAVRNRLAAARLLTSEIFVRGPIYRPVALTVAIDGRPDDPDEVRELIATRLRRFLDPLLGGDDGQGWPFGEPLRPSVLLRESQLAVGQAAEVDSVSIRLLDTGMDAEACAEVPIGPHELVALQEVAIDVQRMLIARSGPGGLR